MGTTTPLPLGSNPIWLTITSDSDPFLIQSHLLGLGPDHSLLCALPHQHNLEKLTRGLACKGRSFIDGEIFEFESMIQEVLTTPFSLRLEAPRKITKQLPRSFPRVAVNLPGTARPLSETGHILAVLPVSFLNLSPTGCQFQVLSVAWPLVSSLHVQLTCHLPGLHHHSKFLGTIEWIQPMKDLLIGTNFVFHPENDTSQKDVLRWFTSQKAKLINTKA